MTKKDINSLLDKYWEGSSSIEEETFLKEYFNGTVDSEFIVFKDLFKTFSHQASINSSSTFEFDSIESMSISNLLNKYWDCTSSIEEEQELRDYFAKEAIDNRFAEYQDLFKVYNAQANVKSNSTISTKFSENKTSNSTKIFALSKRWMAVAASLFLGMMIWFNADKITGMNTPFEKYAVENEDEAVEITMEALAFLSKKLDKSSSSIKNDFKKVANANILK